MILENQTYYNYYDIDKRNITSFSHSNHESSSNDVGCPKYKIRSFSISNSNSNEEILNEGDFHVLCDDTLENLMDLLLPLEEDDSMIEDVDINYSMGVLNIDLGSHGFWVINKQTPNRQIWWSSPISGPRRYEYNKESDQWLYTKANTDGDINNNDELITALLKEIENKTGIKLSSN